MMMGELPFSAPEKQSRDRASTGLLPFDHISTTKCSVGDQRANKMTSAQKSKKKKKYKKDFSSSCLK